jgi:hypothetical protein
MFVACRKDTALMAVGAKVIDWSGLEYIDTTVLILARKDNFDLPEKMKEFALMNIFSSDFAAHFSVSKSNKAAFIQWLFKALLQSPFVKVAKS